MDIQKIPAANSTASNRLSIQNPKLTIEDQTRSLEERIKEVEISEQEAREIEEKQGKKVIRDALLGTFVVGKIAKAFLDWNEGADKAVKDAKRSFVIASYLGKVDKHAHSIEELKRLVTDPIGSTLFNKVMSLVDDSPPDEQHLDHLSSVIKHIAESDFARLFIEHKYALSQIEFMTPQAMTILADNNNWPQVFVAGYSYDGGKITSDYDTEFTQAYAQTKGVTKQEDAERIQHCINELKNSKFIEAHLVKENYINCVLTRIGRSIVPYLSRNT